MASPYRIPHEVATPAAPADQGTSESNVVVAGLALFWLATVVRVAAAFIGSENWGAEPSLAILVVFAVPVLIREEIRARGSAPREEAS
jgi:hypothetical protein